MEYKYSASDSSGKRVTAIASADSIPTLVSRLKKQGLIPLDIEIVKPRFAEGGLRFSSRVKNKELAVFVRQLATIIDAGVLLTEALHTIAEDLENPFFREIIQNVNNKINAGDSFSDGLSDYPKVFSPIFVSLVRSGEEVGNLGATLGSLAKYLEEYEAMREKILSAVRYPIFVFSFMVVIVSIIVLFIIPKFNALFMHAGAKLPLLTRIVVAISTFMLQHTFIGIIILLSIWALILFLLAQFKIRFAWDYYQLRLPLFGQIIRKIILARFCRTLSTLIAGGVAIVSSLRISNEVTKNLFFRQIFEDAKNSVTAGISLSESLRTYEQVPRVLIKMVAVGEKSGKLDEMLRRTADYYEQELSLTLNKLSVMLEPILIIFIGIIVLLVALALYLPIFNLSMAIH